MSDRELRDSGDLGDFRDLRDSGDSKDLGGSGDLGDSRDSGDLGDFRDLGGTIDNSLPQSGDSFRFVAPELSGLTGLGQVTYEAPKRVLRIPNFADACLFAMLMLLGLLVTTGVLGLALHFHWFGMRNFAEAKNDTRLALGSQLMIYLVGLAGAVPFFQMWWGGGFLSGIHWHGRTAFRLRYRLVAIALVCDGLAVAGDYFLPFPDHAPIDKLFSTQGDAWMLFFFGVAIAPFFEELIFRGFLVPAIATAWDWSVEHLAKTSPRPLDSDGNPVWSRFAMLFAALVVSVPFAWMHSAQVAQAWGPLVLLYCVSLILCAVRLGTRSLAASTLVHSAYNFLLFSVMLVQTGGFKHLDKM